MDTIILGCRAKDLVSGFTGIVTGEVRYLNGCQKWSIDGNTFRADGTLDGHWFDKNQCAYVDEGIKKELEGMKKTEGGPMSNQPPRV